MIAKRIPRDKATSNFARLGRYVVDARGQIDPSTWTRTADYILDTSHDGAKVGGVRVTNCGSDDPAFATAEILATQAQNTRSKSDKSYHLVVSFPAGERPPLAVLNQIEDALVASIGFADHQRISAVHTDTEHLHIHVAINKVHPDTFRNVEPYYDHRRLMEACERLEVVHGLQRTNHGLSLDGQAIDQEPTHDRQRDYDHQPRTPADDARLATALRQSYRQALAEEPEAESLDLVRDLSGLGLVRREGAASVLLPAAQGADLDQDEAARHDVLRRLRNGDRGHAGEAGGRLTPPLAGGRAGDLEAHDGRESLQGWIKRHVGEALASSGSWDELHTVLAEHGLRIKPRGAGLVIGTIDGREHVKASQVGRGLSMESLTRRFGPYEPPKSNVIDIRAAKQYRQQPKHTHADTSALFTEFQRARNQALQARAAERERLAKEHAVYRTKLQAYYAEKREAIKRSGEGLRSTQQSHRERTGAKKARSGGMPRLPFAANAKKQYRELAAQRAKDLRERQQLEAQQRAEIAQRHPLPVWQEWLAGRASTGDDAALAVLRSRERKKERFIGSWIKAIDAETARQVIYDHLQPRTDKTGSVLYEVADGGRVKDTKHGVRVEASTDAAAFLGLLLASEKYAGQALIVEGSATFRHQVATLAGAKGLQVTFQDAALEQQRSTAARSSAPPAAATKPAPATPGAPDSIDLYIASRNQQREKTTSIGYHRRWGAADAGDGIYQGRRRLIDGTEAVLLQRGAEVLVMPVTNAQAAKASTWRVGATVTTDNRGRFVGEPRTKDQTTTNSQARKGKSR